MANPGERVTNVASTDDSLIVELADGRSISLPLAWYPRLLHASQDDRDHWKWLELVLGFTGQQLMRIYAWKAFFVEHPRLA